MGGKGGRAEKQVDSTKFTDLQEVIVNKEISWSTHTPPYAMQDRQISPAFPGNCFQTETSVERELTTNLSNSSWEMLHLMGLFRLALRRYAMQGPSLPLLILAEGGSIDNCDLNAIAQ